MSQFHLFADAVRTKFNELAKHDLYVVEVSKDTICDTYLAAFPEGTNPIYKKGLLCSHLNTTLKT